jgi:exosortase A
MSGDVAQKLWLSVMSIGLCAVLVVIVFFDSFAAMFRLWDYSSYNHGYLIPLISGYLLTRDRSRLVAVPWHGSWWGLAALALALLAWYVGRGTATQAVEHLAAVALIVTFAWALAGDELLPAAWFPLGFLFLATPIGEGIVPVLQNITSDVAAVALDIVGVAAFREGNFISLPGGDFEVARACSGFRYLYAGVAMAVLISYLVLSSAWMRLAYVALVAAVFVVLNGFRAFVVMWVASATNMRYMVGEDHVVFGYVLFLGIAALSYWLAVRLAGMDFGFSRQARSA